LCALRRIAFLAPIFFAVIVIVAVARSEALARALGDDDVCAAMSFSAVPVPPADDDPTDLSSHRHACCDLGLCLDGSLLPPATPIDVCAGHRTRRSRRPPSPERPLPHRRRSAHRPRDPPRR
jgi:hypothetical protein